VGAPPGKLPPSENTVYMKCLACQSVNADGSEVCFSCGQSLTSLPPIVRGMRLAERYEILAPIGRGGMGVVYKARDHVLEEDVALKVLRSDVAQSPDMARRFRSEIKLARRVRHPNVCGIHEYGEQAGLRFIAMELIEGVDLRRILQERGALPPIEAAAVASQVAAGLQAIHDVGIIHRDLKAPNVMRDAKGAIRLMDFGIAKQVGSEASATQTGAIVGTPEYMSPEQARGEHVDFRSDVYSLGVLTYELFTGRVPFKGDTPLATILKHLNDPPPLDTPPADRIPERVRAVLALALAKDPAQRPVSAREFAFRLHEAMPAAAALAPTLPAVHQGSAVPDVETAALPSPTPVPTPTPRSMPAVAPAALAQPAPEKRAVTEGTRVVPSPPLAPQRTRSEQPRLVIGVAAGLFVLAVVAGSGLVWLSGRLAPSGAAPSPSPAALVPVGPSASPTQTVRVTEEVAPDIDAAPPRTTAPPLAPVATATRPNTRATPPPASSPPPAPRTTPALPVLEGGSALRPSTVHPAAAPALTSASATTVAAPTPAPATPTPHTPVPSASAAPAGAEGQVSSAPAERPAPARLATPAPVVGTGLLLIRVKPEAEIEVDGQPAGKMSSYAVPLQAGPHRIVFRHPKYEPLSRVVQIGADERVQLTIDLKDEAVAIKKR
jgi:serine/threonine protein kinase